MSGLPHGYQNAIGGIKRNLLQYPGYERVWQEQIRWPVLGQESTAWEQVPPVEHQTICIFLSGENIDLSSAEVFKVLGQIVVAERPQVPVWLCGLRSCLGVLNFQDMNCSQREGVVDPPVPQSQCKGMKSYEGSVPLLVDLINCGNIVAT